MKRLPLALAALLAIAPLHAASKRKPAKDPGLAETWIADPKTHEGKKVTTQVIAVGDTGTVSSEAPYAAFLVTTGTATGAAGAEIPVLVAPARLAGLHAALAPKRSGKPGAFGGKMTYATLTGTFVVIAGEPAIVVGEVTEAAKKNRPSELLAAQLKAAEDGAK